MTQSSPDAALLRENGLLPCPFCGGNPEVVDETEDCPSGHVYVSCKMCEAEGEKSHFSTKVAIAAWNRRAPSAENAVLKALEFYADAENYKTLRARRSYEKGQAERLTTGYPEVHEDGGKIARATLQSPSFAAGSVVMDLDTVRILCEYCEAECKSVQHINGDTAVNQFRSLTRELRALLPTPAQQEQSK